jgi:hypothetical protein
LILATKAMATSAGIAWFIGLRPPFCKVPRA